MKNIYVTILLLITTTLLASENVHLDINTQIENGKGKIIIIQDKEGKKNKIEESFEVNDKTDVDKVIAEILKKHDIDAPPKPPAPTSAPTAPPQYNWIQQLEDVNVVVNDNTAEITIKQDDNGSVKVIKESFKMNKTDDINTLIDEVMKKHNITVDRKSDRHIIQIDRSYFNSMDADSAYFGFMAAVQNNGWQVITVIPESGADKAGLQEGDIIIEVDGKKTGDHGIELKNLSKQAKVGQKSTFKVQRDGKQKKLKITAEKQTLSDALLPPMPPVSPVPPKPPTVDSFEINTQIGDNDMTTHIILRHQKLQEWLGDGHQMIAVNSELEPYFGINQGVLIVNIRADNPLALHEGDVMLSINDAAVTTPKQAIKALSALNLSDGFVIEVMRKKEKVSIAS